MILSLHTSSPPTPMVLAFISSSLSFQGCMALLDSGLEFVSRRGLTTLVFILPLQLLAAVKWFQASIHCTALIRGSLRWLN